MRTAIHTTEPNTNITLSQNQRGGEEVYYLLAYDVYDDNDGYSIVKGGDILGNTPESVRASALCNPAELKAVLLAWHCYTPEIIEAKLPNIIQDASIFKGLTKHHRTC